MKGEGGEGREGGEIPIIPPISEPGSPLAVRPGESGK